MRPEDPLPHSARGAEGPRTVGAGGSPRDDGEGTVTECGRAQEEKLCDGELGGTGPRRGEKVLD